MDYLLTLLFSVSSLEERNVMLNYLQRLQLTEEEKTKLPEALQRLQDKLSELAKSETFKYQAQVQAEQSLSASRTLDLLIEVALLGGKINAKQEDRILAYAKAHEILPEEAARRMLKAIREKNDGTTQTTGHTQHQDALIAIKHNIELAIADGYISENEKTLILKQALQLQVPEKDVLALIKEAQKAYEGTPEVKQVDPSKEKGNAFEKFIVERFNKRYFKLTFWAGDKFHKGQYDGHACKPDLHYTFKLKEKEVKFAVECKFRSKWIVNESNEPQGVIWAKNQDKVQGYHDFSTQFGIPVFVALGIGGQADAPEEVYLIPLDKLTKPFVSVQQLEEFKRKKADGTFFFNADTLTFS